MENVQIIILAGGHGKRMQSELPKVLIELKGKPMIRWVLDTVEKSGICARPVIVVGQKRELVMQTLGENYDYVVQEKQLGTGHAVLSCASLLKDNAENIVVLYGDHPFIQKETLLALKQKHFESGAKITMATAIVPDFENHNSVFYKSFSRIIRDNTGKILKSVEFKDATDEEKKVQEINPCFFCFKASWLWDKLNTLENKNAQGEYYLTDLVKIAISENERVESVSIKPSEALGANSKEELEILERITV